MPSVSDTSEPRPISSGGSTPARLLPPSPNELLVAAESQWLFNELDLQHTPSVVAGLTPQQERENRAKGVNFILQVGIMLKLPQLTLATAAVFLHRFFMRTPMVPDNVTGRQHQHYYSVAATCLFLATKVEENSRKMFDLVVACVRVAQKEPSKQVDEQDKEYWRWRDTILQLEDYLLEALCFDLSLDPPYTTLFDFLCHFRIENDKALRNAAWAFVNDSCLTPLCLLWPSRTIAAAAIYVAARHTGAAIADDRSGRPWWEVMGVELRSIRKACNFMTDVYEHAPLKASAGGAEDSMYQRTPEDGDELQAKTRLVRPGAQASSGRLDEGRSVDEREGSVLSRKRSRDEEKKVGNNGSTNGQTQVEPSWGGEGRQDGEGSKRRRFDEAPVNGQVDDGRVNGAQVEDDGGGLLSPKLESGSEEGELQ